ncbi:phosphatase domain-containing protein [Bdellovibrio sp. HCB185ZH]|uniref:phosphatase domain-containing protein n=1 Tax=Bdellovibrio sp. HCB185ZH TaxID=3394235 RepID=UPI0039A4803E
MKNLICVLLALFATATANAKILVISDIDDTLKVSHILSKAGSTTSAFDDDSKFVGMAEIFQDLRYAYNDIEFHYVSLAPKFLMREQHEDFLEENDFPITGLHMNPGIKQDPDLKQKVIRQLLSEKNPELVIYFGDNGQFDTVVYDQMTKEFPQIPALSYIREAYSSYGESKNPTRQGQIGFVTSVEVVLDLISRNILTKSSYLPIQEIVYKRLMKDDDDETFGKMVFPGWQDCRDFKWIWDVKNPPEKLLVIKSLILQRCQ